MKCVKIEWYNNLQEDDEQTTFELFRNVEKAFKFAEKVKVRRISLVEAKNTFYEDGELNYDDFSDTIIKEIK